MRNGKKIIALDIDDVLANTSDALRIWGNECTNKSLTAEDYRIVAEYWGYYIAIWESHGIGHLKHSDFDAIMVESQSHIGVIEGADFALKQLSEWFHVVLVTCRHPNLERSTREWFAPYLGNDIELYFAKAGHHELSTKTKGEICEEVGAWLLIDDSVSNIQSARDHSVDGILFGNYGWQSETPSDVMRLERWTEILEYLDGIR